MVIFVPFVPSALHCFQLSRQVIIVFLVVSSTTLRVILSIRGFEVHAIVIFGTAVVIYSFSFGMYAYLFCFIGNMAIFLS